MDLKDYLKNYSLYQEKFASLVGISQAHLSNILRGRKSPSFQLAKRIQEETNGKVTFEDLFNPEAPSRLKKRRKKE